MRIPEDPIVEDRLKKSDMIDHIQDLMDYLHFQYQAPLKAMATMDATRSTHRRSGAGRTMFERIREGKVYNLAQARL